MIVFRFSHRFACTVPRFFSSSAKVGGFSSADGESVSKLRARKGRRALKRVLVYVRGPVPRPLVMLRTSGLKAALRALCPRDYRRKVQGFTPQLRSR